MPNEHDAGAQQAAAGQAASAILGGRLRHLHALYVGHWAGNLGDSAVFDAFERLLPAETRLSCEVHTLGDWRRRPQTELIHHADDLAIEQALRSCDAAILLGTTVVTDLHDGEWPIATIIEGLERARAAGRPTHAVAVGVYPGHWETQRRRLREEFVPAIDSFTVRDEASRLALLEAGANEQRITLAADLAWLLDRPIDVEAARREIAGLDLAGPLIAVNAVHEDWRGNDAFYASLAEELDAFAEETGCSTLFLCNEVRPGEYYDSAASRRVAAAMHTKAAVHEVRWMHPEEIVARLTCCEMAVSMRYHFGVFAALADIPWIAFARGAKLGSLLREFGRKPVAGMGVPTDGHLLAALREAWRNRAALRADQRRVVTRLQERARLAGRLLSELPARRAADGVRRMPARAVETSADAGFGAAARLQTSLDHVHGVLAEMTRHNTKRDEAIDAVQKQVHAQVEALTAMTEANQRRDEAIADVARRLEALDVELRARLEDVRRRGLRVPGFVDAIWRWLRGEHGR